MYIGINNKKYDIMHVKLIIMNRYIEFKTLELEKYINNIVKEIVSSLNKNDENGRITLIGIKDSYIIIGVDKSNVICEISQYLTSHQYLQIRKVIMLF